MDIRTIRLRSHQLYASACTTADDVVEWMGAMQAQNMNACKWAIGLRSEATLADINKALDEGRLLRTHLLRPTWHVVAAKNIRWMLELTRPNVERGHNSYVRQHGLSITPHDYVRAIDAMVGALEGGRSLTKEELAKSLAAVSLPTSSFHLNAYLWRAETSAVICSGRQRGTAHTYMLLDERTDMQSSLPRDEALARLAMLYFRSHAPATEHDFAWWSGLTLGDARQGIAAINHELTTMQTQGRVFYVHESCSVRRIAHAQVHLLPSFDEYIVDYKDRSDVLDVAFSPRCFTQNGIFFPVVAVGGKVCGNWNATNFARSRQIAVAPFVEGLYYVGAEVQKCSEKYGRYLGLRAR